MPTKEECLSEQQTVIKYLQKSEDTEQRVIAIEEDVKLLRLEHREFAVQQREIISEIVEQNRISHSKLSHQLDGLLSAVTANTTITAPIAKAFNTAKTKSFWLVSGFIASTFIYGVIYAFGGDPELLKSFLKPGK